MVIEQVYLTCHSYCDTDLPFYDGHLRGPVTLTPVAERLAKELSLPVFTTQVCRDRRSNPDFPHASSKLNTLTKHNELRYLYTI